MSYTNPFQSTPGLVAGQIDNGVDFFASNSAGILCPANCHVYLAYTHPPVNPSGSDFEAWIAATITDGYYQGQSFYFAEALTPAVATNQTVHAGDLLATFTADGVPGKHGIECGWAAGPTSPQESLAHALGQSSSGGAFVSTAAGQSWNRFLTTLGVPSGFLLKNTTPDLTTGNNPRGTTITTTPLTTPSPSTPWPIPIQDQAIAIAFAINKYGVPAVVFMGMYNNETTLGANVSNSSAGAVGPFQFTSSVKVSGTYYPMTNTPNLGEFQQQADAAAAYLAALYKEFGNSWVDALAAYNGGPGNVHGSAEQGYASRAVNFQIPANWLAALKAAGGGAAIGPESPGGTAGAGGTGANPNDSTNFYVGDSTNPDEDFWTAINRIAQERYWYFFSDGETAYLADGPDLMNQTAAANIDRLANADQITHMDFTWDNTAWTYAATHRRRRRTVRRTTLAKVTSPVGATIDFVCPIDQVRAGDVVITSSTGPGDGAWLVGDVRRSVFEVTSEIDLVQALQPFTEAQLASGAYLAGTNPLNPTPFVGSGSKQYTNPVGQWQPSRIDQGVDGTLSTPYVALGDSVILVSNASDPGWRGGGYIAGQLTAGPLKGKVWYVAEGIHPLVSVGQNVNGGTAIVNLIANPYNGTVGNIETGWANPSSPGQPLAQVTGGYPFDGANTAAGSSFNRLLEQLNAGGGTSSNPVVGKMPAGYP